MKPHVPIHVRKFPVCKFAISAPYTSRRTYLPFMLISCYRLLRSSGVLESDEFATPVGGVIATPL